MSLRGISGLLILPRWVLLLVLNACHCEAEMGAARPRERDPWKATESIEFIAGTAHAGIVLVKGSDPPAMVCLRRVHANAQACTPHPFLSRTPWLARVGNRTIGLTCAATSPLPPSPSSRLPSFPQLREGDKRQLRPPLLTGHGGAVLSVAMHPTKQRFALAGSTADSGGLPRPSASPRPPSAWPRWQARE